MRIASKEKITKGWSSDRKYCITDEKGCRYLLRISDIDRQEAKRSEFQRMEQLSAMGIPMCRPVEFGVCPEGVYSIQSWINGAEAEAVLKNYTPEKQYAYGLEAGQIARRIHSIPAPADLEPWEIRFNRKMDIKIQKYLECPLKYEDGQLFLDCIRENRHLLKGRPQSYQHGDYHTGNMMIDSSSQLQIIDFDRDDFGDPWEEFNRIVWCVPVSPWFASGMINGYFEDEVPMDFWKLLALYISSNTLSSLYWAIPFGEKEIQVMRNQAREVLLWYDNLRNPVPSWYLKPPEKEA